MCSCAFSGLGCHGLTADASGLTHLHVALKTELQRHVDAYKNALHRLDEVSTNCKSPTDASHHRLLSLHYSDVQQRLIDNKTLLTLIDKPALQQLRPLVETLAARVQSDKEALFCVSQLKRFCNMFSIPIRAPVRYIFIKHCAWEIPKFESKCQIECYRKKHSYLAGWFMTKFMFLLKFCIRKKSILKYFRAMEQSFRKSSKPYTINIKQFFVIWPKRTCSEG